MKSNHARMISSALVVVAGAILGAASSLDANWFGVILASIGGFALLFEWILSFFRD